jgi:uncharacterized protein
MLKHSLAALVLASSLTACGDRAPHVIQISPPQQLDVERPGQMTVSGQATLEVSPDCADLTITLTTDDLRPGAAVKGLDKKKLALIAALQKIGVENGLLKLSNLRLDPIYERTKDNWDEQIRIRTYRAQITLTATTKDFAKIADMVDAAGGAGATSVSTAFRRSDLAELKKQVRDMALAAAKAKAEQTAAALGISLGRVVSVAENPGGMMWHSAYFPQVPNMHESRDSAVLLGGSLQPLTLDVTVGYELAKQT